jgi:hypothetical protein
MDAAFMSFQRPWGWGIHVVSAEPYLNDELW